MRGCSCRGTAGFAHVSCLAEQAKILFAEAEENNLDNEACEARWRRWHTCSMCEQQYHGVVACALGWACWKTYLGRPEAATPRRLAMCVLGIGLSQANHHGDALTVREAELALTRRLGASENNILACQGKLANTYDLLGRHEEALRMERDVHAGWLRLYGEEDARTLSAGYNYAVTLIEEERFEEAKLLLRRAMPWRCAFSGIQVS